MIENMIMQMIFGGMTGYITNDIAINMLFEKKFGLGGIIPKTREQFVENISELVERDIITEEMVSEEIAKTEFEKSVDTAVMDFLENTLLDAISVNKLSELKGYNETVKNIVIYVHRNWDFISGSITKTLDSYIDLSEIICKEQVKFATEKILSDVILYLEKEEIFENILVEFIADFKNTKIDDFTDKAIIFVNENRSEIEQMIERAITNGLNNSGPFVALFAGAMQFVIAEIPKNIVDFVTDNIKLKTLILDLLNNIEVKKNNFLPMIKSVLLELFKSNQNKISNKIQTKANVFIEGKMISDVLTSFDLQSFIKDNIKEDMIDLLLRDVNIGTFYNSVISDSKLVSYLLDFIREYVAKSGRDLQKGNVKKFVSDRLSAYSDEKLKITARNFVGKNLRPISYFGAFLGVITGFLISFVNGDMLSSQYLQIAVYMTTYGLLGWGTNFIAINMIFTPYKKHKMIPYFSPGYIVKNKPVFAKSLGDFIENEILSGEIITNWISKDKVRISNNMMKKLAENDFIAIRTGIANNKDEIIEYVIKKEINFISRNIEILSSQISALIINIKLKIVLSKLLLKNGEKISGALIKKMNSDEINIYSRKAIIETTQKILQTYFEKNASEKLADYIYNSFEALKYIPLVPENMIKEILKNVLDSFVADEIPIFVSEKASDISKILFSQVNENDLNKVIKIGVSKVNDNKIIGDYIMETTINKTFTIQLRNMLGSETFLENERNTGEKLLNDLFINKIIIPSKDVLEYYLKVLCESAVYSLEKNIGKVLKSVNFAEISEKQVLKLDGKELHMMFDSFMHKYFISLRRYGIAGAVFGINRFLSIALMGAYFLFEIFKKIFKKKS